MLMLPPVADDAVSSAVDTGLTARGKWSLLDPALLLLLLLLPPELPPAAVLRQINPALRLQGIAKPCLPNPGATAQLLLMLPAVNALLTQVMELLWLLLVRLAADCRELLKGTCLAALTGL
jgi:hypothetical protein